MVKQESIKYFYCKQNNIGLKTSTNISPSKGDIVRIENKYYKIENIIYDLDGNSECYVIVIYSLKEVVYV